MYSRAYTVDYFIEGHRFNILEDIGCYPAAYLTPLAFVLLFCWPLAIGVVSAVYGCKSISFDSFCYSTSMNILFSRSYYPRLHKAVHRYPCFCHVLAAWFSSLLSSIRPLLHWVRLHHRLLLLCHRSQCSSRYTTMDRMGR